MRILLTLFLVLFFSLPVTAAEDTNSVMGVKERAEKGDVQAQFELGLMYELGTADRAVRKNPAQAMKWYRKAAEHGFTIAQYYIGGMYEKGRGVEKDYSEAYFWYRLCACVNDLSGIESELSDQQKKTVRLRLAAWLKEHPAPAAAKR
jgi:TPR repeat protein